jgi:hypothetical protein
VESRWIDRVARSNWLPPATLVLGVTLFFWHILQRPVSAWVGDACSIDFQGTVQQLWLLRFHNFDLGELSRTVYMTYPTPVNLLAELGFLLDIGLLASMQALFGAILGYNIGAWVILVGLALAVYHCARRYGLSPWFAAVAGLITVSASPIAEELTSGRFYQILSLATATLCLAEWPKLTSGDRFAALRLGCWLTATLFAHAFTGQLIGVFLLVAAAITLCRIDRSNRRMLVFQYLRTSAVLFLLATGPALFQLSHLPSGEKNIEMLSGFGDYYHSVLQSRELEGLSPFQLLRQGHLRFIVVLLAAGALFNRSMRSVVLLFVGLLAGALFVVWGPYYSTTLSTVGADPISLNIPLPYLILRAVVPYFWRMLWLKRVVLFGNLALGILAAMTLSWAYYSWKDRMRRGQASLLVAIALFLSLLQPVATGFLPLHHTLAIPDGPGGLEAAALLERVRTSPEVKVVISMSRALHLQQMFEKPVSSPKWAHVVSCHNQTLSNCGWFFESFVPMPSSLPATEQIRLGLCHLEQEGTTHLLFFPKEMNTRNHIDNGSEEEALMQAQQEEIRGVLRRTADLVDAGGGIELFRLRKCEEAPAARSSTMVERK